jgi:hypothetical protein
LLLLSMYPLGERTSGPTARIGHVRDELARRVELDVISGYRPRRRARLARYAASGRLRGLDGIYVESSTFLPAEADIAFLGLARGLGIRVVTYIRDAYQLFPDEYPVDGLRRRAGVVAFRPAVAALRAVSHLLAFPTQGLATAVLGPGAEHVLLPPGAPPPVSIARDPGADRLLLVGDARLPAHGADRLGMAVEMARAAGVAVGLDVVTRPGDEPPGPLPGWLRIHRGSGSEIHALLPGVIATVIPRPRSAYNDLALPVKLFEYLSYGRPLLVTDCVEQARVVADAGAGVVTADDPLAMADAIGQILHAGAAQLDEWSARALVAARAASWERRAARIVELFAP